MASGFYTDKLPRRKPIAVVGYLVTALGTASFGLAGSAWHILLARTFAWLGRGVRTPIRKALLAAAVTRETYGRAFGFERMMDTVGAIAGPITALILVTAFAHDYRHILSGDAHPGFAGRRSDRVSRQGKGTPAGFAHFVRRTIAVVAATLSKISRGRRLVWRGRFCARRC